MDSQTASAISLVASQTDILKNNVLLVDKLENEDREKNLNLECVIMCRCTKRNVEYIKREISEPKYTDYSLIFTSFASQDDLEEIAQSDKKEVIKSVYEFYFDYHALDESLFTLDVPSMIPLVQQDWDHSSMRRMTEGLLAALLSFQKLPSIRFQANSEICKELARRIEKECYRNEEINRMLVKAQRRYKKNTMLLIVDRRDDPVTPLLTQWTYQAMVHENLSQKSGGIVLNRVALDNKDPPVDIVLSSKDDEFFRENMTNNWGDLCLNIKDMVDRYKQKMNVREDIKTIDDIRNFITNYPQFKQFSNQVDKHVTLVHALKDIIASRNLLEVSKLEQEMSCSNHPKDHFRSLSHLVISPTTSKRDALRLSLLYALRYENYNGNRNVEKLAQLLREEAGFKQKETALLTAAQHFAGEQKRNKGLFGESGVFSALKNLHRTVGLTDVENVYTQHKPLLSSVIEQAFTRSNKFNATFASRGQESRATPDELIIFVVGGVTYEESLVVHEWNKNPANGERRVVLGGTTILNSKSFMKEIQEYYKQQSVGDMLE